jgi:DNA sulfur modification protein DndB
MPDFEIHLPAIRGVQAGRPFFIAMCPIKLIPRLIPLDTDGDPKEDPLSRQPDRNRSQEISRYLSANPDTYVLPAISCVVDAEVDFKTAGGKEDPAGMGMLKIPLRTRILLLDGINRRAAIEAVLKTRTELGDETIPVVFYVDFKSGRAEQLLSDIRRNGSRSGRSQGILCDFRDETARISREVVRHVTAFADMTETLRSTISNRSFKLFTLSAIYHANQTLLSGRQDESYTDRLALAVDFWSEVAEHIPDWGRAKRRETSPAELRKQFVHAHAIALAALSRVGKSLLDSHPKTWRRKLKSIRSIDWSRANVSTWEGRAMIAGRLSKSSVSVILTGNALKHHLGLPLDQNEQAVEESWMKGRR